MNKITIIMPGLTKNKKTLKNELLEHNNDYGFNPLSVLVFYRPKLYPSLSIIIPYYETGTLFLRTLHHLYNSIKFILSIYPSWKYEVIVVDDGSRQNPAHHVIARKIFANLKLIVSKNNLGRTFARNQGLEKAKYKLCLFMDSDVLIDLQLIASHLKIHSYLPQNKSAITVSFFEFTDSNNHRIENDILNPSDISLNDYRLYCIYGRTWYGCESDKKFIGKEFRICEKTDFFRKWKYKYAAWVLPNMVLGGFFITNRKESVAVKGFERSFQGYGFTETSLPTKLIAIKHNYIIPILIGGGVHIEDKNINIPRRKKDLIFRKKHRFYFKKYLELTIEKATL